MPVSDTRLGRVRPLTHQQQVPHVSQEVKDLIEQVDLVERGFFSKCYWALCKTFVIPGDGYWRDGDDIDKAHKIEKFRRSTHQDFVSATPRPMPEYIKCYRSGRVVTKSGFNKQARSYHLCKKVAVSFGGQIYRATDEEIESALQHEKGVPSTAAATYVRAVQEVCRRHASPTAS